MASAYREINPLVIQIASLAGQGYTDRQIGEKIGFSFRTVYRYRHGNGITPGRYQKEHKPRTSPRKPKYNFLPLDKLILN